MPTNTYLVGGGLFGLAVRIYSLGLQARPLGSNPLVHVAYTAAGVGMAYWMGTTNDHYEVILKERRERLTARRLKRLAEEKERNQSSETS